MSCFRTRTLRDPPEPLIDRCVTERTERSEEPTERSEVVKHALAQLERLEKTNAPDPD